MKNQYFATLPTEQLSQAIEERIKAYFDYAEASGKANKWKTSSAYYYGKHLGEAGNGTSDVEMVGEAGELTAFGVNQYRNLIRHVLALTTTQRPSPEPMAANSDTRSIQQARLASNIIEAYATQKRLSRHLVSSCERALVAAEGYVFCRWDQQLGKPVDVEQVIDENNEPMLDESGQPIEKIVYEGDFKATAKSPWDVCYDIFVRDWSESHWVLVREWMNKWELAAKHPAYADEISELGPEDPIDQSWNSFRDESRFFRDGRVTDFTPVWHFYHKKTDSMPKGRYAMKLSNGTIIEDRASEFEERIPLFQIKPGEKFDSAEGYTDAWDLLVLQQVYNVLSSIMFTNQQALATNMLHLPDGCDISVSQIGFGMSVVRGGAPGTEPKVIALPNTPGEVFKNQEIIENTMEKLIGINSVVRGEPPGSGTSGAALGRLQAMAIQYSSNLQRSWAEIQEDVYSFLLYCIQKFAKTERIVAMAGKANKGAMVSFTGSDVDKIMRVSVGVGNPLKDTAAGRIDMAEKFFDKGAITPQEFIQVVTTGALDPVLEGENSQLELIRKENELLMDGKPVKAIVGDRHFMHSEEHMTVINDPQLRTLAAQGDQGALAIVQATLNHIMEHKQLSQTQDPFFSQIVREPMAQAPPPPQGPPPQGKPSGPEGPPPQVDGAPPEPPPVPPLPGGAPPQVSGPQLGPAA